jgi:C4-dicarboxylate-specific signal transduction histidine kinase
VVIIISDAGTITRKELLKYMKPFIGKDPSKGLGLGLFITSQIIKALGGELRIQERPTRFQMRLPYA